MTADPVADALLQQYLGMTPADHRAAITTLRGDIGTRLLHLGKAVRAWKVRGGDQLYAPLLAKIMRDKKMTTRLSRLSFEDQKHIGDGGKVDLLVMTPSGPQTLAVDPIVISDQDQLNQLFDIDKIRSVAEQRIWIEARKARAAQPIPESIGLLAPDPETQRAKILGRHGDWVTLADLKATVRALERKRSG